MRLYTSGPSYRGNDAIDISKMGTDHLISKKKPAIGAIFAPSWRYLSSVLIARKGEGLTDEQFKEYRLRYYADMRKRYKKDKDKWIEFLDMKEATITCFCITPDQCHRRILAKEILRNVAYALHVDYEYLGERQAVIL